MSTINFSINGKMKPNHSKMTTASPFLTQKFLKRCAKQHIQYVVIEASSHALHQSRLLGIPFRIAALTNITHEHLDYHGTMEKYKNVKKQLFHIAAKKGQKEWPAVQNIPHKPTLVLNTADKYFKEFDKIEGVEKLHGAEHKIIPEMVVRESAVI